MSVINTNVKALVAQESMRSSNLSMSQAMERLSTGSKINSAKDDAAGLAITNRMTSQIRGMAKAIGNVNDAISMSQTAEGAMGNVGDILQRMRELAVQAGTGTMNDSDRSSLQLEVSQLKQQIEDIANKTNHNNIKLLDGTAQNVVIQSGVSSGETMKIGFDSMKTKDIGIGSKAFLQSAVGTSATRAALVASSLYLNGVAVGASLADDDSASPLAGKNTSAIAKAAAINRVANLSGVYAKAEGNYVSGTLMTAQAAVSTGTVTINGVVTDQFSTSLDTSLTRKTVVNAINAISSQTGVTATDTGDDKTGVTLLAADGRNINLTLTTLKSASTGLKLSTATTYVGSYSLYTLDGRDISVGQAAGDLGTAPATVENTSGLQVGTYKADTAIYTTSNRDTTRVAPSSSTTGLLYGNAMIINGTSVSAAVSTDDTSTWEGTGVVGGTSSTRATSAIAIAAAINRSSAQTGVTAKAAPNILRGTGFTAATASVKNVLLNGVRFTVSTNTVDTVIDRFNEFSSQTGVTASRFGGGMQLEASDGRTIVIGSSAANTALGLTGVTIGLSGLGTSANAYISSVQLTSDKAFTVQAGSLGNANLELLGFFQGTYGASKNGLKVAEVDISTVAGATQAIAAVDSAINTVSAAQAKSGAINNRLDSIINNLAEGSKNMQSSRSRILDTDYATETTNLAKQQIIQQAATAMLAQANQSSQSILSLLK
jgi:flagellin